MAHVQLDGSSTLIHRSWLGMCTSRPNTVRMPIYPSMGVLADKRTV